MKLRRFYASKGTNERKHLAVGINIQNTNITPETQQQNL